MITDYSDTNTRHADLAAAVAERDALRELVAAQAMTNAELAGELADMREAVKDAQDERDAAVKDAQDERDAAVKDAQDERDAADEINAENLAWVREDLKRFETEVTHRVEDLLLLFMGERRPVRRIEPDELRRLAEFVFEGA